MIQCSYKSPSTYSYKYINIQLYDSLPRTHKQCSPEQVSNQSSPRYNRQPRLTQARLTHNSKPIRGGQHKIEHLVTHYFVIQSTTPHDSRHTSHKLYYQRDQTTTEPGYIIQETYSFKQQYMLLTSKHTYAQHTVRLHQL
jgi:hypothetical protein